MSMPPNKEQTIGEAVQSHIKKCERWGTAPCLHTSSTPWEALLMWVRSIRNSFKYLCQTIYVSAVGYLACRRCWHRGRIMGMSACFHPEGIVNCLLYLPLDGLIEKRKGRLFLQRPPFLFRLKHWKTWRKMRLAAIKLSPQEHPQGEAITSASSGSQLAAVTRRAFIGNSSVGYTNAPQVVPPGPLTPPPSQAPNQGRKP